MSEHECIVCHKVIYLYENSLDNHLSRHNMGSAVYHEKFFEQDGDSSQSSDQISSMGFIKNHPAFQAGDKIYETW